MKPTTRYAGYTPTEIRRHVAAGRSLSAAVATAMLDALEVADARLEVLGELERHTVAKALAHGANLPDVPLSLLPTQFLVEGNRERRCWDIVGPAVLELLGAAAMADAAPKDPDTDADLDAIDAARKRMVDATTSVIQLGRVAVEEVARSAEEVSRGA